MKVLKFWLEKFKFMILFARWREWMLVSEEWKVTYVEMQKIEADAYKIYRETCARLLRASEK